MLEKRYVKPSLSRELALYLDDNINIDRFERHKRSYHCGELIMIADQNELVCEA